MVSSWIVAPEADAGGLASWKKNHASPQTTPLVVAAVARCPRHTPTAGKTTRKAGLLAPGSPVLIRLPGWLPSGVRMSPHRLQLRGQPRHRTAFPQVPSGNLTL